MAFASLVRSTVGFGEALIAMPLLVQLLPLPEAAAFVATAAFLVSLMILGQDWRSVRRRGLSGLVIASWLGVPVGFVLVALAPKPVVLLLLAGVILLFCGQRVLLPLLRRPAWSLQSDRWAPGFGFAAGILGGAYNTQGPPVVFFGALRGWTPREFRATIQAFALATIPVVIGGHWFQGRYNSRVLTMCLAAAPCSWLAVVVGRWLHLRIDAERFAHLVHLLLVIIAGLLIVRALQP
ncbi:MAG: TSUP family transporter [Planctomycetales bacterium]|nr:TSUP family transporter [Planctomycetales bacterium]